MHRAALSQPPGNKKTCFVTNLPQEWHCALGSGSRRCSRPSWLYCMCKQNRQVKKCSSYGGWSFALRTPTRGSALGLAGGYTSDPSSPRHRQLLGPSYAVLEFMQLATSQQHSYAITKTANLEQAIENSSKPIRQ